MLSLCGAFTPNCPIDVVLTQVLLGPTGMSAVTSSIARIVITR